VLIYINLKFIHLGEIKIDETNISLYFSFSQSKIGVILREREGLVFPHMKDQDLIFIEVNVTGF